MKNFYEICIAIVNICEISYCIFICFYDLKKNISIILILHDIKEKIKI